MIGSIIGGLFCIFAGLYLATLKAAASNSLIQYIANGMGVYFIGKGIYIISFSIQVNNFKKIFIKDSSPGLDSSKNPPSGISGPYC